MATTFPVNGIFHCKVRFDGVEYKRTLKTRDQEEARRLSAEVEATKVRVMRGYCTIPEGVSVPDYLFAFGRVTEGGSVRPKRVLLSSVADQFFATMPPGMLEDDTLLVMRVHQTHLLNQFGKRCDLTGLQKSDIQKYVNKRASDKGRRGRPVVARTIIHELSTLRSIWGWCISEGLLKRPYPGRGLRFPKSHEMPPFQTMAEIEPQLVGLPESEQRDLWASVYLTKAELEEFIATVSDNRGPCCALAMVATAAHTGMRRAELIRATLPDLKDGWITIRERKRQKGRRTTRRVPLSELLRGVLEQWLGVHPGGPHLFCRASGVQLTRDAAHHQWKYATKGTKWEVLPGFHCLRHSFISNLASDGVDQRTIDGFVGHTTEAMRQRYRHILPDVSRRAIQGSFG